MADDDKSDTRLLLHDAIGHLEAAFIKIQDLNSTVPVTEAIYEASKRWRSTLADLVNEARGEHDTLVGNCDTCGCPKRSS